MKRLRVAERRFRGLRCVHTHLSSESLTRDDLTDLAILRLDSMSAIEVQENGLPGLVHTAHLAPITNRSRNGEGNSDPWQLLQPVMPSQINWDYIEFISQLEAEFAAKRGELHRFDTRERAILVGVTMGGIETARERLVELAELAKASNVVVLESVVQRRKKLDPRYLIGKGKIEELVIRTLQEGADLIIFDQNLTPAQMRSINSATDLKILDRTQLILDVFAQRAQSREGKLQVELAQLRYLLPRLTEMDTALSRLTGGIGGRGPGETKLEIDRRRARDRIVRLQKQIRQIKRKRTERRKRRVSRGLPIVTFVGYTNAGKSSLLNRLTKSNVAAGSRMFETLDPTSRRLRVPKDRDVLLADTVGFIRDLPSELVEAFQATLEEIEMSVLILHIIDSSDPEFGERVDAVSRILTGLKLQDIPQIVVFNKSDLLSSAELVELEKQSENLVVSARTGYGTDVLVNRIGKMLKDEKTRSSMLYSHS